MTREEKRYNHSMWFFVIALLGLLVLIAFTGCAPTKAQKKDRDRQIEAQRALHMKMLQNIKEEKKP